MRIWKKIICTALAAILAVPMVPGLAAREVEAASKKYVVVLDPGHGGGEAGARGYHNGVVYKEEEINWKISQYTKKALSRYSNIKVYMTRTEDEYAALGTRVSRAAAYDADILVSQHINSATSSSAHGASVMISKGTYRPYLHEKEKLFGTYVHQELGALGLYKRFPETGGMEYRMSENGSKYPNGQPRDYYGIVAQSVERNLPGVIIEHCFISNYSDATRYLRTNAQLKKLGEADARAIVKYLNASGGGSNNGDDSGDVVYEEGWVKIGDDYYYRKSDGTYLTKQWLTIDNKRYYLDSDGRRTTGWMSGYYFDANGVMQTGWQKIGNHKFYLGTDGKRAEGYRIIDNVPYYFATPKNHGKDPLGAIQTGWKKLLGNYYYFTQEGAAATGWSKIQKHWYYMDKKGVMQTGWVQTKNGNHYYLFAKDHKRRGQRATNETIIRKGKKFKFDSKGVCVNYDKVTGR